MMSSKIRFTFKPVRVEDRSIVHEWLGQPHIAEWIHGVGLQNTLNGLEKFFLEESDTTYWIGYDNNIPFAFLITSPEGNDATTLRFVYLRLELFRKRYCCADDSRVFNQSVFKCEKSFDRP